MDKFLCSQLFQHTEVYPHRNLYMFDNQGPRVGLVALKQKGKAEAKSIRHMEETCNELMSIVDKLT